MLDVKIRRKDYKRGDERPSESNTEIKGAIRIGKWSKRGEFS